MASRSNTHGGKSHRKQKKTKEDTTSSKFCQLRTLESNFVNMK